jgi:hypothetical protein
VRASEREKRECVCVFFSSGVLCLSYLCDIISIGLEVLGWFDVLGLFIGRLA